MFTFQNGGTEVEGAGVREDGVFAVSHEIFSCSYNEKNMSKNNERSESNSVNEKKEKEKKDDNEKINDDDKKKEKKVMDAYAVQKIKVDVPSTATAKCTTSDGTCVGCTAVCNVCVYIQNKYVTRQILNESIINNKYSFAI